MYVPAKQKAENFMEKSRITTIIHVLEHEKFPKRQKMLAEISGVLENEIYDSSLEYDTIECSFEYGDCTIETVVCRDGSVKVEVMHENDRHSSPLLEMAIADVVPDWGAIEKAAWLADREEKSFRNYLERNSRYW